MDQQSLLDWYALPEDAYHISEYNGHEVDIYFSPGHMCCYKKKHLNELDVDIYRPVARRLVEGKSIHLYSNCVDKNGDHVHMSLSQLLKASKAVPK